MVIAAESNDDGFAVAKDSVSAGFVALTAGAGALAGYLIGRTGNKRVLLYESK